MSFKKFYEMIVGKMIRVYVCDSSEEPKCIVVMNVCDCQLAGNEAEVYGLEGNMVRFPVQGEYKEDEEGYRCERENNLFLISII